MDWHRIAILLFLILAAVGQGPIGQENRKTKNFENFSKPMGGENYISEDYKTFPELSIWAYHNGLKLAPDRKDPAPGAGTGRLFDNQCRMVPETGLDILLIADSNRKDIIYVYFDLTHFSKTENAALLPERELRISANGILKRTIRFPDANLYSKSIYAGTPPVYITVDPSELREGRLNLNLTPLAGEKGRFWGVWDVFLSYTAPEYP
ncbi:LIC10729 family protein [Leptospira sp. SA-E8]|uniref:LIC10729 family protein n=1 Tax=Leptospira sp. SA-E8 TaxID=3422259 RepID=UPI003EB7A6DE